MRSSSKKALLAITLLAIVLEVAYVLFANSLIRGEYLDQALNKNPEKLQIRFQEATSYWPGLVSVKNFEIMGHDGAVKWQVNAHDITAWISLSRLLNRTLLVNSVSVNEAQVQIALNQERLPPSPKGKRPPFRLKFRNLHIKKLSHVQLHDYRYDGEAEVRGDFDLWPGRELNIWKSEINFAKGLVLRQDTRVLENIEGSVGGELLNFLPQVDKKLTILNKIKKADFAIKGLINEPNFLNLYLQGIPWLSVPKLKGALNAKVKIRDGHLDQGSQGEVKAERIDLQLGPYTSQSWGRVTWKLSDKDVFKMAMSINDYKFFGASQKKSFMTGKILRLHADTKDLELNQIFSQVKDLGIGLLIENAKVTDLDVLNDFIPVTDKFKIKKGEAELDAKVYLSTRETSEKGFFKLKTVAARSQFRDMEFTGDAEFSCSVQDTEEGITKFQVSDTNLVLKDVSILNPKTSAQRKVKDWKGSFKIPEATLRPYHNIIVDGSFNMRYDNAEPILIALGSEFRIARLLQAFAAVNALNGSGEFKIGPKLLDFSNIKINSSDVNLLGRYRFFEKTHKFVAWFQFETFKAAFDYDGKKSNYSLTNAMEWYKKKPAWAPIELVQIKNFPEPPDETAPKAQ